jgi:hypothetical protein
VAAWADDRSYALAVEQAHSLVKEGQAGRSDAAARAREVLLTGTGQTQPEILGDLDQNPPNYTDAEKRLSAVAAALGRPGDVENPAQAKAKLDRILAQDRYKGLRTGQSLWDSFWNWVFTQIFGWLSGLDLAGVPGFFWLTLVGIAAAVAALVAGLIVRTGWTRAGRAAIAASQGAPIAHAADRFVAADAAAARQEYGVALRALVAAVATHLSGRPFWETSPLTVRELFRSRGRLDQLRPLLHEFELAVYGGREVGEAAYRRAEKIAEPYRQAPEEPADAA